MFADEDVFCGIAAIKFKIFLDKRKEFVLKYLMIEQPKGVSPDLTDLCSFYF